MYDHLASSLPAPLLLDLLESEQQRRHPNRCDEFRRIMKRKTNQEGVSYRMKLGL